MFGYVRPFKPYMRICEYDTYKGVYCGLCKTIGKLFGFIPRLTLSYDFTFLSLIDLSVNETKICGEKQRCIAHPLNKTFCVQCSQGLEYSSYAAMLLVYHKLKDDLCDNELKHKLRARVVLPFFKKPYKKASAKYPELAKIIEEQMEFQRKIEHDKCDNIDLACEPTAKIMEEIFGQLDNGEKNADLKRFGYLLGRYIYLCDAFDDVKDDFNKNNYNPLLLIENNKSDDNLSDEYYNNIKQYVKDSVNFTLGELAEVYVRLDLKMYKSIIDNVIYLGLKNVFELIEQGKFNGKKDKIERKDGIDE